MGQKEARMCRYVMHVFCAVALSIFGMMGSAQAVSLGKVDVASHLGEPFYAEVPLGLDEGEVVSSIFVELASSSDYRILEVFRDQSLDGMRIDVKNDSRGSRVELTSTGVIDAPFFNLVLKVRQGRATHFKKYAVFLELPRFAQPNVSPVAAVPSVKSVNEASSEGVPEDGTIEASASEFKSFDGWARTNRYGPMVFGDTITTVAQRLRVDDRFTTKQVMVALFEKNKDKFGQENINLINAGTYLDVPSASEVEQVSRSHALSVLKDHNSKWKALTQQTKYAKIKDAQENRYGKRVHMGEEASGVASKPLVVANTPTETATAVEAKALDSKDSTASQGQNDGALVSEKNDPAIGLLQNENNQLKQRLLDMESKVAELSNQPSMTETLAASDARIKKLEIQLARQSGELEKAREQALAKQQGDQDGMGLMAWILLGLVGLLSIVAGYLAYALRGQRNHPVEQSNATMIEPEIEEVEAVDEIEVEESSSEEGDFDKTIVASADDFDHTMLDELPELTDEDTSEMEAFTEQEEEADPNVDYLTEADVYMRYGMEDEAEKQVRMALRLNESNKDALVKLVQIRHARGNQAGVDEAAATAQSVLTGDSLASFTTAFELLGKDSAEGVSSMDDTMPPTEQEVPEAVVDDMNDAELGMDDFDLPEFSAEGVEEDSEASPADDATLDFDGLDFSMGDENLENVQLDSNVSDASELLSNDDSENDFDLTGLDLSDDSETDVGEVSVPDEDVSNVNVDDSAALVENNLPSDVIEETDLDDDGFDLSDLEMPEIDASSDEEQNDSIASSIESGDFDKTVAMDWSSDTALLQEDETPDSESGADEIALGLDEKSDVESTPTVEEEDTSLEFDLDSLDLDDEGDIGLTTATMAAPEGLESIADQDDSDPAEHLSSVEFDLDDLDVDLDAVEHDADLDAFTSTIQATLQELGVESDLDETSDGIDLSLDDDAKETSESNKNDSDFDFDGSLELDDLLSDLEDLSEDDKKKS